MRRLLIALLLALPLAASQIIAVTLPAFDGPLLTNGDAYPRPALTVGTFSYSIPAGDVILSATLVGTLGSLSGLTVNSTAPVELYVFGNNVATCTQSDPCYSTAPIPWTFSFPTASFGDLQTGAADLLAIQTGAFQVHLGQTTLTIVTETPVAAPEPANWALMAIGASVLLLRFRAWRNKLNTVRTSRVPPG